MTWESMNHVVHLWGEIINSCMLYVGVCGHTRMNEAMYDSDNDISWLTQEPSLEVKQANFDVGQQFIEDEMDLGDVVSLEENTNSQRSSILYDNVVVEDISLDENIDQM